MVMVNGRRSRFLREKAGRCGMTRDWELGEYGCELLLDSPPKAREKALVIP
jgi:hypothetical protein